MQVPPAIAEALRIAADERAIRRAIGAADGEGSELQRAYIYGVISGLDAAGRFLIDFVAEINASGMPQDGGHGGDPT